MFVINYDFPTCTEDYVHRMERARGKGDTDRAFTFFTRNNDLIGVLEEANQVINPQLYEWMGWG